MAESIILDMHELPSNQSTRDIFLQILRGFLMAKPHLPLDITTSIMERLAFGIPFQKWLDIFTEVTLMINKAKKTCGGDGAGCRYVGGTRRSGFKCSACPMIPLRGVMEAMK